MSDYDSGDGLFDGVSTPPNANVEPQSAKRKQAEDDYGDVDDDLLILASSQVAASSVKRTKLGSKEYSGDESLKRLARGILAEQFGYDSFRHEQEGAISAILRGDNALAVFPTGAGKSLCYQVRLMNSWSEHTKDTTD